MSAPVYGPRGVHHVNAGVRRGALSRFELGEMHSQIRFWYSRGLSDMQTALHVGCSSRTVQRYRYAHDLPANQIQNHVVACRYINQEGTK